MLTPTQLTAISQHLKKSGIIYEEVHDELLDHFANAIDEQMRGAISFENALIDVGRQFGGRAGLKYIQTTQSQARIVNTARVFAITFPSVFAGQTCCQPWRSLGCFTPLLIWLRT